MANSRHRSRQQSLNARRRQDRLWRKLYPRCYFGNGRWSHNFRLFRDWEGDPTIPYGTRSLEFIECANCGDAPTTAELATLDFDAEGPAYDDDPDDDITY